MCELYTPEDRLNTWPRHKAGPVWRRSRWVNGGGGRGGGVISWPKPADLQRGSSTRGATLSGYLAPPTTTTITAAVGRANDHRDDPCEEATETGDGRAEGVEGVGGGGQKGTLCPRGDE